MLILEQASIFFAYLYSCLKGYYDAHSTRSTKFASFGKGKRHSIIGSGNIKENLIDHNPPPGQYNPIDSLKKMRPSKAYTFGASREVYKKVLGQSMILCDINTPGPGSYSPLARLGNEGNKISMKARIKNLSNHNLLIDSLL